MRVGGAGGGVTGMASCAGPQPVGPSDPRSCCTTAPTTSRLP